MKILMYVACCFALLYAVSACSTADTTGNVTEKDFAQPVTNSGGGTINMFFVTGVSIDSKTTATQTTDNDPSTTTNPATSLGLNGGSSSLADKGASMAFEKMSGLLDASLKGGTVKPSAATVAAREKIYPSESKTSVTSPAVAPSKLASQSQPVIKPVVTGEYNTQETVALSTLKGNSKQYSWLANTGAFYGGKAKVVFGNGCGELDIPDMSVTHGADGNPKNYNQAFYFCGTDFKPGADEYHGGCPNGCASVFVKPGCNAGTATIHYNRSK